MKKPKMDVAHGVNIKSYNTLKAGRWLNNEVINCCFCFYESRRLRRHGNWSGKVAPAKNHKQQDSNMLNRVFKLPVAAFKAFSMCIQSSVNFSLCKSWFNLSKFYALWQGCEKNAKIHFLEWSSNLLSIAM